MERYYQLNIYRPKILLRVMSAITLAAFFVTTICGDLFMGKTWAEAPIPAPSLIQTLPAGQNILNPAALELPHNLGTIRDQWAPEGQTTPDKVVIHIQDAHCNYYAQQTIRDIVKFFHEKYSASSVNLEGGEGAYDLSIFTSLNDRETREYVADYFLKTGVLSGPESLAVNSGEQIVLWGMEDPKLYLENLKVYRDTLPEKETITAYVNELDGELSALKTKIYSPELLELDRKYTDYKLGTIDFKEYLTYLMFLSYKKAIDIKAYINIYLINQSMSQEDNIDFKAANAEREELIDRLLKILSRSEVEKLVIKTVQFKSGQLPEPEFYAFLLKKSKMIDLDLSRLPELQKYIVYVSTYAAVDKAAVAEEINSLESRIKESIFRNTDERDLDTLSKDLVLMRNMFSISISRDDYEYYTANKKAFAMNKFRDFIRQKAPSYGVRSGVPENIGKLDAFRGKIERFYECSFKRDDAFIKNLNFDARGRAIVVTGGFHSENLCELLKKNNIAYVSIMPNFRSENGYESPYFELLGGKGEDAVDRELRDMLRSTIAIASPFNQLGKIAAGEFDGTDAREQEMVWALKVRWLSAKYNDKGLIVYHGKDILGAISSDGNFTKTVDPTAQKNYEKVFATELTAQGRLISDREEGTDTAAGNAGPATEDEIVDKLLKGEKVRLYHRLRDPADLEKIREEGFKGNNSGDMDGKVFNLIYFSVMPPSEEDINDEYFGPRLTYIDIEGFKIMDARNIPAGQQRGAREYIKEGWDGEVNVTGSLAANGQYQVILYDDQKIKDKFHFLSEQTPLDTPNATTPEDEFHEGPVDYDRVDDLIQLIGQAANDIDFTGISETGEWSVPIRINVGGREIIITVEKSDSIREMTAVSNDGSKVLFNPGEISITLFSRRYVEPVCRVLVVHDLAVALGKRLGGRDAGYNNSTRMTAGLTLQAELLSRSPELMGPELANFWQSQLAFGPGDKAGNRAVLVQKVKQRVNGITPRYRSVLDAPEWDNRTISGDDANKYVSTEIMGLFKIVEEIEKLTGVPIGFIITGGTARDFVIASTGKVRFGFPRTTDIDFTILLPEGLEEPGEFFEEVYVLFADILKERFPDLPDIELDYITGIVTSIDGDRPKYAYENMLAAEAGNAFTVSRLGVMRQGNDFVVFGRPQALDDLFNTKKLNILHKIDVGLGEVMAAKMIGKSIIYGQAGFELTDDSCLKLAAEIKSALETEGMEKLVTDIKRHAITDENPNVPDEVIVQAVNNVLTRASAASGAIANIERQLSAYKDKLTELTSEYARPEGEKRSDIEIEDDYLRAYHKMFTALNAFIVSRDNGRQGIYKYPVRGPDVIVMDVAKTLSIEKDDEDIIRGLTRLKGLFGDGFEPRVRANDLNPADRQSLNALDGESYSLPGNDGAPVTLILKGFARFTRTYSYNTDRDSLDGRIRVLLSDILKDVDRVIILEDEDVSYVDTIKAAGFSVVGPRVDSFDIRSPGVNCRYLYDENNKVLIMPNAFVMLEKENKGNAVMPPAQNALDVRVKTVVQGFSEAMRASEVITIVGLPQEMFDVENAALKDKTLINISKTLGKKGYGQLGDGHQIIAVPVDTGDAAATEKAFMAEIDKASSRGCMVVVFAPELDGMMVDVNGVKTGIAEALGARYKDTEAGDIIKIVPDAYTDSKPSEKQYPDILVRVLLARHIAWYYSGNPDILGEIKDLMSRISDNEITTIDDLFNILKPLRIRPINYQDIKDYFDSYVETAISL